MLKSNIYFPKKKGFFIDKAKKIAYIGDGKIPNILIFNKTTGVMKDG